MCKIPDDEYEEKDANFKPYVPEFIGTPAEKECFRCGESHEAVSSQNHRVGTNWLCPDCSAIVLRGEAVVYDYDFEKFKSEKVINDLVLACEAALLLRGLWMAITDPLALAGEKEEYRKRFKEIEAQIRVAINAAKK